MILFQPQKCVFVLFLPFFFTHAFGIPSTSTCSVTKPILDSVPVKVFRNAAGMLGSTALLLDSADAPYQGASLLLRLFFHTCVCMTYSQVMKEANGLEDLRLGSLNTHTSITADTLYLFHSKL